MYPGADSSQLRAELAVMRMFRDLGIPADVFLSVQEIERHWPSFGVRAGDLPGAIDRMVQRGLVVRRPDAPGQIACTVAGANAFDEQPGWLESHLLTPRIARARCDREAVERGVRGPRRRRGGDAAHRRGKAHRE